MITSWRMRIVFIAMVAFSCVLTLLMIHAVKGVAHLLRQSLKAVPRSSRSEGGEGGGEDNNRYYLNFDSSMFFVPGSSKDFKGQDGYGLVDKRKEVPSAVASSKKENAKKRKKYEEKMKREEYEKEQRDEFEKNEKRGDETKKREEYEKAARDEYEKNIMEEEAKIKREEERKKREDEETKRKEEDERKKRGEEERKKREEEVRKRIEEDAERKEEEEKRRREEEQQKRAGAPNTQASQSGEDICARLERGSSHLSPLTTISKRINVQNPPLTPDEIALVYRKGCGLLPARAADGQPTWREGAIEYIPSNNVTGTGERFNGTVVVYNADFEPYIAYNHNEFFEGREHPPVDYRDRKIILSRLAGWDDVDTPTPLKACPDLPCLVTTKWDKFAPSAAAITFNDEIIEDKAPKRFHKDQVFIMNFYEPLNEPWKAQQHMIDSKNSWRPIFNWTMTYHLDSDIPATYGMIRQRPSPITTSKNYNEILALKTKAVAWFVSNCFTNSKREDYVAEMQKYIPIDIYGECGPFKCKKEQDTTCFSTVGRDYKFYLAFENSICEDYTTEKFFRIFNSDTVVVVRGNDYLYRMVPRNVFIDAAEFGSPKALAQRLLYLNSHPEEYMALLRRKDEFFASYQDYPHYMGKEKELWVKYTWENVPLCEVCQRLWNLDKYRKSYPDIFKWRNDRICHEPSDL